MVVVVVGAFASSFSDGSWALKTSSPKKKIDCGRRKRIETEQNEARGGERMEIVDNRVSACGEEGRGEGGGVVFGFKIHENIHPNLG